MYEYIAGTLVDVSPTEAIVEAGGVGYRLLISLSTFSSLQNFKDQSVKIFTYHQVREDDEALFGFADKREREVFVLLISVNGVGPGSARMVLSAMTADETREAIVSNDVNRFKAVKGIGLKTAQRIILELKDKIGKCAEEMPFAGGASSAVKEEASSALTLLGFAKPAVEKVVASVLKEKPDCSLEELIKKSLKML